MIATVMDMVSVTTKGGVSVLMVTGDHTAQNVSFTVLWKSYVCTEMNRVGTNHIRVHSSSRNEQPYDSMVSNLTNQPPRCLIFSCNLV